MSKECFRILSPTLKTSQNASHKKTKKWSSLRNMTGEKLSLIACNQSPISAIAHLLTSFQLLELLLIEFALYKKFKSNFRLKSSLIAINQDMDVEEVMSTEFLTGARGRALFLKNAILIKLTKAIAVMIIWLWINADKTILSSRWLITAWQLMNKELRRKYSKMGLL